MGTIERSHRTLNEYLRSYISNDKSDWDEWMKFFVYCYNTSPSTVHEYCPFELVYGKIPTDFEFLGNGNIDPLYNIDAYAKEVKYRLQTAHKRAMERLRNSKLTRGEHSKDNSNGISVSIGDHVLVKNDTGHKLDKLYNGPFEVIEVDNRNNVRIKDDNNKSSLVHKNRIRKYYF